MREILLHPAFVCIGLIECIFAFEKAGFAIAKIVKSIEFDCFNSVVGMLATGCGS